MIVFTLLSLFLAAPALGQDIVYDSQHNVTSIYGTWASGSQGVVTGPGFAQPANESFLYPVTSGLSFSFTVDGYFETARYRMTGNGSQPSCITGVMNWIHGTYQLLPNGSIVLTPFDDGYQQIQDPCAPVSNFIENYNDTELYVQWNIYQDPVHGYTLQLYQYNGVPLPPQWQVSTSPNMLPTQPLRNVTTAKSAVARRANVGERSWDVSKLTSALSLLAGLGVVSLLV